MHSEEVKLLQTLKVVLVKTSVKVIVNYITWCIACPCHAEP